MCVAGDRVIVIGVEDNPLNAEMKDLTSVFQKVINIPRPDYGSRLTLWRQILTAHGAKLTTAFDLSSLAKISGRVDVLTWRVTVVSDGYTALDMTEAAKHVLSQRRIKQQARKPLTAVELVAPLARRDPVSIADEMALTDWSVTPVLVCVCDRASRMKSTPLGVKAKKAAAGDGDGGGELHRTCVIAPLTAASRW